MMAPGGEPQPAPDTCTDPPLLEPLRRDDLEQAVQLDQLCFPPQIAFPRSTLASFLAHPGCLGFAARVGGRLVAFVIIIVRGGGGGGEQRRGFGLRMGGTAEVVSVDVHPEFRRRGLGRTLLRRAHDAAAARGARRALLHVACDNLTAQALYEREGYRRLGRARDYYGAGQHAYAMAKQLELPSAP